MCQRILILSAVLVGLSVGTAPVANAWVVHRVAPVRRLAARTVLPPYPVARRVIAGRVYRPVIYRSHVVYRTSGDGTSGDGTSGDGTSGDGTSGDGTSGDGTSGIILKLVAAGLPNEDREEVSISGWGLPGSRAWR